MDKKSISKLVTQAEKSILKWLKPVPHLPKNATKWIADNVWWFVIISMIVMIVASFLSLIGIFSYLSFVGNAPSYVGIYNTPIYSGLWLFYTVMSLIFSAILAYVYSKAIAPLRKMRAMGWRLMLIAFLISALRTVLSSFADLNAFVVVFSLIFSGIFVAVGAYLLFEIRHYFVKD